MTEEVHLIAWLSVACGNLTGRSSGHASRHGTREAIHAFSTVNLISQILHRFAGSFRHCRGCASFSELSQRLRALVCLRLPRTTGLLWVKGVCELHQMNHAGSAEKGSFLTLVPTKPGPPSLRFACQNDSERSCGPRN